MASLKQKTFSGLIWASIGNIGHGVINLLVTFVLARILLPSDFGVLELVLVITSISTVLVDSGFSQAIIRDKEATDLDKNTVFWVNISIATVLYLILFITAPAFATFFKAPGFAKLGRVAFISIIIDSFSNIQNVTFTKELKFRPIAIASLLSVIIAGIIAIILASLGWGVWALIVMILATSVIKTGCLWLLSKWRPAFQFSRESLIKYFKFGSFILVQSLIDKIALDIESIVTGRFYTKAQLGYFAQSRTINSYFGQALTSVVVKVSYPALVKVGESDEKLKHGYRSIVGMTSFVVFPIMIFIFFFPYDCMEALFGHNWVGAGKYLRLWACIGLIQPIQSICNNIFLVKGKSRQLFTLSAIKNITKIIIVLIIVRLGIYQLIIGIVVVSCLMALLFLYYSGRLIQYRLLEIVEDVLKNTLCSVLSAGLVFLCFRVVNIHVIPIVLLLIKAMAVALFYVLFSTVLKNSNYSDIRNLVFMQFKKK